MTRRPERRHRQRAERAGRLAERAAVLLLWLKGYRIIACNARTPVGEIDIVARRGAMVAIVEVKRRADIETAIRAVTTEQQRRIARAAEYLSLSGRLGGGIDGWRFDVIVVRPWRLPRHMTNMWRT